MSTAESVPTIHLFSFGYKFSGPPLDESGHGGGFVFDCRALPNPFWDEALRPFSGREDPVVAFMEQQPAVLEFGDHALWLVHYTAAAYRDMGRERLMVSFGCTGGRHRSVYLAERTLGLLRHRGHEVLLDHRDVARPSAGEPL